MSLLHFRTAQELIAARKSGELSALELVEYFLERIERHNPTLNALVTITPETARDEARKMDHGDRDPGVLWGLPFADKDLTARAGVPTGSGSRLTQGAPLPSVSDPMAVALDEAGGISLGKSAVCEFGLSSYTESEVLGPTRNPYGLSVGAGGSSGGAAAAVAGGLLPVAPGSDGGGSVRIPAWTCGLVGFKPSRGLLPVGTGFDSLGGLVVPGPLARNVSDAALLLDAMKGSRPSFRATGVSSPPVSFQESLRTPVGKLTIAVTTSHPWGDDVDIDVAPEALAALEKVVALAEQAGHRVTALEWKPRPGYFDAFSILWRASAATLDVPAGSESLLEPLTGYLVEAGRALSARDLALALRELSQFETHTIECFSPFDVILTPGLAAAAPLVDSYDKADPERNFTQQIRVTPYSSFVNVSGLPAVALPVMASPRGVPVGVQLVGRAGGDATVLGLAREFESQLDWALKPAIFAH